MRGMILLGAVPAMAAFAQNVHQHAPAPTSSPSIPIESGEDAFAAIREIVSILRSDSQTDWSKVSIEALRRHLIDLNNVTLGSVQSMEPLINGAVFTVTGAPEVAQSVQRVASAHFVSDNMPAGWSMKVERVATGAVVTVTSAAPGDAAQIRSLGFVGLMTLGGHHQRHHLMMARGVGHH